MLLKKKSDIVHKLPLKKNGKDYPYSLSCEVFRTNQAIFYSEKVRPKTRASAPHWHKSIDEVIYVTKGELCAHEGNQKVTLKAGDSVCFQANSQEKHYLENESDECAEFLIFRRSFLGDDVVYE